MPLGTPFYTIVLFTPHWIPNGSSNFRTRAVPMMLSEAVAKALTSLSEGLRPAIEIDGTMYTDAELFHALRMRPDFPV
ncbi:MAG: hypothetical protein J0I57_18455 [Hyphomicrobium sp.]|mgnify:CR=1 FL=1|nr:hypothetical protein [Hyphomicrobium sp.]MBN9279592.1 hypothetical protein [Hyphomicrobium sp.]